MDCKYNVLERSSVSRRGFVAGAASVAAGLAGAAPIWGAASAQTLRTRLDIVTFAQDPSRLANFEAAVGEMQARSAKDPSDPKGWLANADMHKTYCSVPTDSPDQIHFCWWFLAWHRAYIFVTEKKIRTISGDDGFSYPYWNWSTDRGIPGAFARTGSPLANAVRYARSRQPLLTDGEVGYRPDDPHLKSLGVAALDASAFEAATPDDIATSFGGIARPNAFGMYANNALEATPHNPVHVFVGGSKSRTVVGDMATFDTAARDPIFFAHHGNLDRLWETWRKDPAKKASEPTGDDFLKHAFPFKWLDGTILEVAMSDIMDTEKLEYRYDSLDVLRPTATVAVVAQAAVTPYAPILSAKVEAPLFAQAARPGQRRYLEIYGVRALEDVVNAGVFVVSASGQRTEIGAFATPISDGRPTFRGGTLLFDVTALLDRLGGQQITVEFTPMNLGDAERTEFPQIQYDGIRFLER